MAFASMPVYTRIAEDIRHQIESARLKPGDRLPSERELQEHYSVSRATIRSALGLVEQDGLLRRTRGRGGGTYVKSTPPIVQINRMEGFLPQLRQRGMTVTSEILHTGLDSAQSLVGAALHLEPEHLVFRLVRLRSVDGIPILLEDSYFPVFLFPDLLEHDLHGSIYELMRTVYNQPAKTKQETILPGEPTPNERSLLHMPVGHQLLRIRRTAYDSDGVAIEYSQDAMRCDVAQVQVTTS